MDNYTKHNTKPKNIIGKKTGYTKNGIDLVYTKSFYDEFTYTERQNYCGSYLISEVKKQFIQECGEDAWIETIVRHMIHDKLAHFHHYHDDVGLITELRKGPKPEGFEPV